MLPVVHGDNICKQFFKIKNPLFGGCGGCGGDDYDENYNDDYNNKSNNACT